MTQATNLNDQDWTITTSEFALLNEDLSVHHWWISYLEIRESAMGRHVVSAIRMSEVSPWEHDTSSELDEHDWQELTPHALRGMGVPQLIIDRLQQKGLM